MLSQQPLIPTQIKQNKQILDWRAPEKLEDVTKGKLLLHDYIIGCICTIYIIIHFYTMCVIIFIFILLVFPLGWEKI